MSALVDLLRSHTDLGAEDGTWLQRLTSDWQIVADLSFADLVLWVPDRATGGLRAVAQMRPTTAPTAYVEDVVGDLLPTGAAPLLESALREARLTREGDAGWRLDVPVRTEAIPVCRGGRALGVIARSTNLRGVRTPSQLELSYLRTAGELAEMISEGRFPHDGAGADLADSPRVGDGFIRVDATGRVGYASPNAQSVYRRLGLAGDLVGHPLGDITRDLVSAEHRADEERLGAVLGGRVPADLEVGNASVTLIMRSIPLRPAGEYVGALLLVRDVSDLRRRDRELISKEATIREIHHRVKNNLQTVAALLRLQARRMDSPAREALDEAVRRVGSIAQVHETLSQAPDERVDFDDVADRLRAMVTEMGSHGEVATERVGSFGEVRAERATALAMVLTELMANAVEHGFGAEGEGRITVRARRHDTGLVVEVEDDGRGLPPGFDPTGSSSLGLSIVRTLVDSELHGRLEFVAGDAGGTLVRLEVEA